ncbi:MAG: hypothetical protein V4733_06840 [Verrucomicrobiota bacterium]
MKRILTIIAALVGLAGAQEKFVMLPWPGVPVEVPVFYSVNARVDATVRESGVEAWQTLEFRVLQGNAERVQVALTGDGEVHEVTGHHVKDWAVRKKPDDTRTLEVATVKGTNGKFPTDLQLKVRTTTKPVDGKVAVLLPAGEGAAGFSLLAEIKAEPGWDWNVVRADGLTPAEGGRFLGNQSAMPKLELVVSPVGFAARGIELRQAALEGTITADGESASFQLTARMVANKQGAELDLLDGAVAMSGAVRGDGWHIELRKRDKNPVYVLVADKQGESAITVNFEAKVSAQPEGRRLAFRFPAGVVVPVALGGLPESTTFDATRAVVPRWSDGKWRGFLPVAGEMDAVWRGGAKAADGALFFATTETSDVRAGNGLLRQTSRFGIRVLQGKLNNLRFVVHGNGEVLSVTGRDVVGWNVAETGGKRFLEVRHARPPEGAVELIVTAQAALTGNPMMADALRFVPEGALRHSGIVRIGNEGAVRVEVRETKGLIQLAPDQFPTEAKDLRQAFVFRFPSADYGYRARVEQILPEVAVTEVTRYGFTESDRVIESDIEFDVRDAPVREWEIEVPADFSVAEVSGAKVADYVLSAPEGGKRKLKIVFRGGVSGRVLVALRLEKNEAPKAGDWQLAALGFPGVKSHRGYVAVSGTAGYRITAGATNGLVEVPVTFFPKRVANLQAAFRLREPQWSATMKVEALGQSVQADVFHLYALRTGGVTASVVINYFVVGAPATEWRVEVPEDVGNLDVAGQNVGRDWRREGKTVIVPLTRPITGAGTLLISFEHIMNAGGGSISPGEVRPLGVQEERGFVQVVSPLQVNINSAAEGPVLPIVANELPPEYKMLSSAPTVGAWQYTARDFKIEMKIQWYEAGETVDQMVDFAKLESRVARDGQWVTEAVMFVKTLGKTGLRLGFPEQVKVWEMKVGGAAVNPRRAGAEYLVPLPQRDDPNEAVEVRFLYGADATGSPHLLAPRVPEAPWVMGEWIVRGDEGRVLLPRGGSADVVEPLARNGWTDLTGVRKEVVWLAVAGIVLAVSLAMGVQGWASVPGIAAGLFLVIMAAWLAVCSGFGGTHEASVTLRYAAPVVPTGALVDVKLANVPGWRAAMSWMFWLFAIGAATAFIVGWMKRSRNVLAAGGILIGVALLSARVEAGWFLVWLAVAGGVALGRLCLGAWRGRKRAVPVVALIALCFGFTPDASAATATKMAESASHEWSIRDGRLTGVADLTVSGKQGERFLLVREPAVLTGISGDGLKATKGLWEGKPAWLVEMERDGVLTGRATFELAVAEPVNGFEVPVGPAASRIVRVRWDQPGWQFTCPGAIRVKELAGLTENESGAELVPGAAGTVALGLRPKPAKDGAVETKFFVESSDLFSVSPGVVNGLHRLTVRPAQGQVLELIASVPDGFTVGDVREGPVRDWRYDPAKRELRVTMLAPQSQAFSLIVETQRGAGALPWEMKLEPLRVNGAAGTVGTAAVWFSDEIQAERVTPAGMSKVNPEDFDASLLPKDGKTVLQHVFRYGMAAAAISLKAVEVAPELRAEFWQLVSLGEDRLTISHDFRAMITRAGVFRLDVEIPDGLDIESVTGEGLAHWVENRAEGKRLLTLHLAGKTMGARNFSIVLTSTAVKPAEKWLVPKLSLSGATRETGIVTVVPERGLQVRMVERNHASSIDPRELADETKAGAKAAVQPGALAFRVLQKDWSLALAVRKLDAWVVAKILQDITVREGQASGVVRVMARIDNAAVKSLRVGIPGLDATAASTVRASGAAVADLVPVAGESNVWDVKFPRGMAGDVSFELAWQQRTPESGEISIQPVVLQGVRQLTSYVAVRADGRLELDVTSAPRGWQKSDWGVVKSAIDAAAGSAIPALVYRVSEPEGPLVLRVKRHELAGVGKLRVSAGTLLSLVSPRGDSITAADLRMNAVEKTTLRMRLPEKSRLFIVTVNGERVPLVRNGDDWMFYVSPSPVENQPSMVRIVYLAAAGKRIEGPVLNVPMENLRWRVLVPEGWKLTDHEGDFEKEGEMAYGDYRVENYQSFVASKRATETQTAVKLLDQANEYLAKGDQQKAGQAFNSAANLGALDAASGEDARVQLRALKTEQAMLGLNTRRQKMQYDNRQGTASTPQPLDQAVQANPIFRGEQNYDPSQVDSYFVGNSADENAALKEIAGRIVSQQLAVEPALASLDVTLPERGEVVTFTRSVQTAGEAMGIELEFRPLSRVGSWTGVLLCLLVPVLFFRPRRNAVEA